MTTERDSGDEIFITQNSFCTQTAAEAAEFLENDMFWNDIDDHTFPEDVVYYDFSDQKDNSSVAPDLETFLADKRKRESNEAEFVKVIGDEYFADDEEMQDSKVGVTAEELGTMSISERRFGAIASDQEVENKCSKKYTHSTNKKCDWAHRMFEQWIEERNKVMEGGTMLKSLVDMSTVEMVHALSRFIIEVRKKNGSEYPAETLYEIVVSLQLWLHMRGKHVKFLDDDEFIAVRNCLDNRMKELSKQGYAQPRNQAGVITVEQENDMWLHKILGSETPKQLVDTLLYLFGVHFAMRAGVEHRSLRVGEKSQITLHMENGLRFLLYKEDVSKSNQGGLDHRKIKPKIVRAYENVTNPDHCIVNLYLKYLSVRPEGLTTDDFYLRPLARPRGNVWYSSQPIGKNTLTKIVGEMAKKAGIEGKITNHSLRASSASRMYNNNVDEQLICKVTGHRSNAVRSYKRTCDEQHQAISKILYGNEANEVKSDVSCEHLAKKPKIDVPVTLENTLKGAPVYVNVNVNFNK